MGTIANAKNTPLNIRAGTIPDVSSSLKDWFQPMTFQTVSKTVEGFQVNENGTEIRFWGVIQPFTERQLQFVPEGQRAWTWLWLHAEPALILQVDEVVLYRGVQTRVVSRRDYDIYGYVVYTLVQDWTGSGPQIPIAAEDSDSLETEAGVTILDKDMG